MQFDVDAAGNDYEIDVVGTGVGDFTLEVAGVARDGSMIEEQVTGTIRDGEVQSFLVDVPEAVTADGSIERIETSDDEGRSYALI